MVELYQMKKGLKVAGKVRCVYTELINVKQKTYTLDEKLKEMGRFESTKHRRIFLYSLFENPRYEKACRNCGQKVKDVVMHGMEECKNVEQERKVYKMRMEFYNVPKTMNILKKTKRSMQQ